MLKKVAVVGPECTGKSAVSAALASHFNTEWVPEYARAYIENLGRPYVEEDLLQIALGQLRAEDVLAPRAKQVLICDTNLYVIKVWSNFRFSTAHPKILELIKNRKYDLYLLMKVDIPWTEDPQREHPHRREELYDIYLRELQHQPVPFAEIGGSGEERTQAAIAAVEKMLKHYE